MQSCNNVFIPIRGINLIKQETQKIVQWTEGLTFTESVRTLQQRYGNFNLNPPVYLIFSVEYYSQIKYMEHNGINTLERFSFDDTLKYVSFIP